jgi:hypothetical protein
MRSKEFFKKLPTLVSCFFSTGSRWFLFPSNVQLYFTASLKRARFSMVLWCFQLLP